MWMDEDRDLDVGIANKIKWQQEYLCFRIAAYTKMSLRERFSNSK